MSKDPVVEEVRQIRDAYARQFNYDIDAICQDLAAQEKKGGRKYISLSPKLAKRPREEAFARAEEIPE